jgi:hypothetical protein
MARFIDGRTTASAEGHEVRVRASTEEVAMLAWLAEREERTVSDTLRRMIRQSYRDGGGPEVKPKRRKRVSNGGKEGSEKDA